MVRPVDLFFVCGGEVAGGGKDVRILFYWGKNIQVFNIYMTLVNH